MVDHFGLQNVNFQVREPFDPHQRAIELSH